MANKNANINGKLHGDEENPKLYSEKSVNKIGSETNLDDAIDNQIKNSEMAGELLAMPKLKLTSTNDNDLLITRQQDTNEDFGFNSNYKPNFTKKTKADPDYHNNYIFGRLKTYIFTIKRVELTYRSGSKLLQDYFKNLEKKFAKIKEDPKILKPDSVINT